MRLTQRIVVIGGGVLGTMHAVAAEDKSVRQLFNITGPGDSASRQKIFICSPGKPADEGPCATKILTNLAHAAYRRPVTSADVSPLSCGNFTSS